MSNGEMMEAERRERSYRFFAGLCLAPPSDSIIDMIRDGGILAAFKGGDEAGLAEMSGFVIGAKGIPNLKDELAAEHTALFVLPSGVLPHEALYLDIHKRLGGRVTAEVQRFYEKAGANILDRCGEVPDHMGMELDFMGFLCAMEKQLRARDDVPTLNKCITLQKAFLEEHLLKWAHRCCDELIKHSTYGFYKAVARFASEFLRSEEEYIKESHARTIREGENICETAV